MLAAQEGGIGAMRDALREAILDAGGRAAEGAEKSLAKPLPGTADGSAPHLPDIVHSTVLRWTAEPFAREEVQKRFKEVAERLEAWSVDSAFSPPF